MSAKVDCPLCRRRREDNDGLCPRHAAERAGVPYGWRVKALPGPYYWQGAGLWTTQPNRAHCFNSPVEARAELRRVKKEEPSAEGLSLSVEGPLADDDGAERVISSAVRHGAMSLNATSAMRIRSGDLQDAVRLLWALLTPEQKKSFDAGYWASREEWF